MTDSIPISDFQADIRVWENRWLALNNHLAALKERIDKNQTIDRYQIMSKLVEALKDFSNPHFYFFFDGFSDPQIAPAIATQLEKSKKFPPAYVFRQLIDRVSEDYMVIQQCIEDRLAHAADSAIGMALIKADKLATAALMPIIQKNALPKETVVLTYFQKKPSIRVIPYASVALVGVPLTVLGTELDYLALYHEVGHYVYRHAFIDLNTPDGKVKRVKLADQLSDMAKADSWLYRWNEEIFADIYGALIGNFAMAIDFQYIEDEAADKEFVIDDGKHPIPSIRPEIYLKVLDALPNKPMPELVAQLRDRWEQIIANRQNDEILPFLVMKTNLLEPDVQSRDTVLKKIDEFVRGVLEIPEMAFVRTLGTGIEDDLDPNTVGEIVAPQLVSRSNSVSTEKLEQEPEASDWLTWVKRFKPEIVDGAIPEEKWLKVLSAEGWTTEGPHDRPIVIPPG